MRGISRSNSTNCLEILSYEEWRSQHFVECMPVDVIVPATVVLLPIPRFPVYFCDGPSVLSHPHSIEETPENHTPVVNVRQSLVLF